MTDPRPKIDQITPTEAAERLAQDPDLLYVDVRTVEEFSQGHPPGALNLPLLVTDPATGQMTHNPEFVIVAQAVLDPSTPLIVGCASGKRSMMAIANLGDYGYTCANVSSGFSGQRDFAGNIVQAGWSQLDLPVEEGDGGDKSWAVLRRR